MTLLQQIKPNSCSCDSCKKMCNNSPCFPTPDEAQKLIDEGHADKLHMVVWPVMGVHAAITPKPAANGHCIFQDDAGLCTLHEAGLKPLEGRMAHHDHEPRMDFYLRLEVAQTWENAKGLQMMYKFPEKNLDVKKAAIIATTANILKK